MKESNRKRYRVLGWDFADHLAWTPQLRGNSKRSEDRTINKIGRNAAKKETKRLVDEAINS